MRFKRLLLFLLVFSFIFSDIKIVNAKETDDYKTFSQLDSRWASYVYDGGCNLGGYGCMITSIAILMAYANEDLRDVNTFNPKILSQGLTFDGGGGLYSASVNNVDSTFSRVTSVDRSLSASEAKSIVSSYMKEGYYLIVKTCGAPVTSYMHWGAIVGMDGDTPVLWDVAGGAHSDWNTWANAGINCIVVFQSSNAKSYKTMVDSASSVNANKPTTEEEIAKIEKLKSEYEIEGMSENFRFIVDINLPGDESLTELERVSMENIKENIVSRRLKWYDYARIGVSFLGLCCIVYGFLLGLAYLFDRTNNLLEISLLGILTLGRYKIWEDGLGIEKGYSKDNDTLYCDSNMLIIRIAIVEIVGFILVSGIVFNIISKVVLAILNMA